MDQQKRLFGIVIGFVVASFTASAVSTFAWYATNRERKVTMSSLSIHGHGGSLEAHIHPYGSAAASLDTGNPDYSYGMNETLASEMAIASDLSSPDGVRFYQPQWRDFETETVDSIRELTGIPGYYTEFLVSFTNSGPETIRVFLGPDTDVLPSEDNIASKALASWTRTALSLYSSATPLNPLRSELASADTLYILERSTPIEGIEKTSLNRYMDGRLPTSEGHIDYGTFTDSDPHLFVEDLVAVSSETSSSDKQYLFDLPSGTTVYGYGTVWLEGTAYQKQDQADGGSIDLSLSFRAVDA